MSFLRRQESIFCFATENTLAAAKPRFGEAREEHRDSKNYKPHISQYLACPSFVEVLLRRMGGFTAGSVAAAEGFALFVPLRGNNKSV